MEEPHTSSPQSGIELGQDTPKNSQIWSECLAVIQKRLNSQSFKTWFEPIVPLSMEKGVFTIQVPSQFFSEWIEEHYYSLINEAIAAITGSEMTINYIVGEEDVNSSIPDNRPDGSVVDRGIMQSISVELPPHAGEPANVRVKPPVALPPLDPTLNPKYTFDNYIKGESNQFARAAALAVAHNPGGTSFNPLVIYGGVGLGKTHLVYAIGNHVIQSDSTKRVLYVSSEKFTVDFVEAIQKDNVSEFSNYYRSVDLLMVDDIQFLAGKEKTQDIFFHTFNALHQLGKQIVLSSDRPPKDLKGLNERLISRFHWGLTADIQPPDLETRIAILLHKSQKNGIELSQDVVEFIASNVTSNIREMEGCLISLLARASLENRAINIDLAREVVRSLIGEVRSHVTIEEIQRVVCETLNIPEDLIRAKTRKQEVVNARQIAMYLSKEYTNSSLKTIGLHFGGRDHSTVIHAYQTIEDSMKTEPQQALIIQQIKAKLERSIR